MFKILLLTIVPFLALTCSQFYNNTMIITATQQEIVNIPFNKIFSDNDYQKITLSKQVEELSVVDEIHLASRIESTNLENKLIISQKFQKKTTSLDPLHYFSIMSKTNAEYKLETSSKLFSSMPELDKTFSFAKPNSVCYDFVQIDQDFIVDCKDENGDYFAYISNEIIQYQTIRSAEHQFRKLDQIDNYIYRSSFSEIELYQLDNGQITLKKVLDSQALTIIIQKEIRLLVRDFKTHTNGQVSIMNAQAELLVLEYKNDNFVLIKNIFTNNNNAFGYDYDVYSNTYVVIQDLNLYYFNKNGQNYTVNVTYNSSNKVYLTNDFIIFQEREKLTLFSQSLYKIKEITFQSTNFVSVLSPRYNEIFALDSKYVSQYLLNQYPYLSFKQNEVSEDFSEITLKQEYSPYICKVLIKYKVVEIGNTDIHNTQLSEGLLSDPVLMEHPQAQLKATYIGPNLKYQFQTHAFLNFGVEQTQQFKFNNLQVTNKVIYQQIFYYYMFNSVYLIQQVDKDMQFNGYICEIVDQLNLNCQQLFSQKNFQELKTSPNQLWWLNYDSLFLAVLKTNQIEIYCIFYKQDKFSLLTTIPIKAQSITTNGQYLIATLDESVEVYQITVQDKATKIMTFQKAEKVFATPGYNDLFLYDQNTLYLYNLEQKLQTLVWYQQLEQGDLINLVEFENHFVVLLNQQDNKQKALVYNLQVRRNIVLQKQLSFYEYSQVQFTNVQTSTQNNFLFLLGFNQDSQKTDILAYQLTSTSLGSLFTVFELPSKAQFSSTKNYLTILNEQGQMENYYLTGENFVKVQLSETYQQVNYTSIGYQQGKVYNTKKAVQFEQIPVQLVNRGIGLFQTQMSMNLTYVSDGNSRHCAELTQTWYSGQALSIVQTNQREIQYVPTITKLNPTLGFSEFIQEFDSETLIQINGNKVIMISKETLAQTESTFESWNEFTNLLATNGKYVFVENKQTQYLGYFLQILVCENMKCTLEPTNLNFPSNLRQAFIDKDFLFLLVENQILVYDTKGDFLKIQQYEKILTVTPMLYCWFLQVNHLKDNLYQFIAADAKGALQFYNYDIKTSQNYFVIYDSITLLKNEEQYIPSAEFCAGLYLTKQKNQLVLIYSLAGAYTLNYQIDCSKNELCELKDFKLLNVYQQYGDGWIFNLYRSTYMNEDILSIVYFLSDHYELLLFDISDPTIKQESPKLTIGGFKTPELTLGKLYQIQSFVYKYKNTLYLFASPENQVKLYQYQILRAPQFCITKDKIDEQMSFKLSNSFHQITTQLRLTISEKNDPSPPDPNPLSPEKTDGKFPIWIIFLIVAVVGISGVVVYKYCKNRKNEVNDSLLGH